MFILVGSYFNLLLIHNDSLTLLKLLDFVQFTLTMLSVNDATEFLRKVLSIYSFFWLPFPDSVSHGGRLLLVFWTFLFFLEKMFEFINGVLG